MRISKKRSITNRIIYAFSILLLLYTSHAIIAARSIQNISRVTKTIHNHPLVVSNASLRANSDILKMHRNMKDVVMLNDKDMIKRALEKNSILEKNVKNNLQIVQNSILGKEGKKLSSEALILFVEWEPIRNSVVANLAKGNRDIAAKTTWSEGAKHVEQLEEKMSELSGYARKKATGFLNESNHIYKKLRNFSLLLSPLWGLLFFAVAYFTIKRTHETEKALSGEKEKLNVTLRSIGDGVITTDSNGNVTFLNEIAEHLTGWDEQDAIGKDVSEIFHIINEMTRKPCKNPISEVLQTGRIVGLANHTVLIAKDGIERAIADSGAPIRNSSHDIVGVVLVFRDQTEEYENQKRIFESERMYRLLSENTLDVIWTTGLDYRFSYINRVVISFFGYTQEECIGTSLANYCDKKNWALFGNRLHRLLEKNQDGAGVLFETEMLRKNGDSIWVENRCRIVLDRKGNPLGFQGVTRDISERKVAEQSQEKLEKQLYQAQKMESVGRLAGGVAHDFNNMLSVILGYTNLALDECSEGSSLREDLTEVREAALRSAGITKQLLAFARKQTIAPETVDLNKAIDSLIKMLGRLIGEDIILDWLPDEKIQQIKIDPTQIDQILANLCVNSRDAIFGVGKITIETCHTRLDEGYCREYAGCVPGEYVSLVVSDNGSGMDREVLDNAFEPFYTTKGVGRGTGLGLSTVYGIVKQNNGYVNVYSEPGKGTTVKIYFPQYTGDAIDPVLTENVDIPLGKGETVILVEDEAAILKYCKKILNLLGYNVLDARSPKMAISMVNQYSGNIDLLITDVVMPEMNGRELAKVLNAEHDGLKILYMSGYTANAIAHRGILDDDVSFIQKPFSQADIATKIRRVLGDY